MSRRVSGPVRRGLGVLVAVLVALAPAACAGAAPTPPDPAPVRPVPAGTTLVTGPPAAADTRCDPEASLTPVAPPAPGTAPPGSALARIAARGILVVGVDQNSYPFGYRDPATGALAGFDVAVAREMAASLLGDPGRLRLRTEASDQRIPNLLSGDVDLVVQTMTVTCERRRQIQFSSVYYRAAQRVLLPRTSPARGLEDLGGRPVCSIAGSTSLAAVQTAPSRPVAVSVPEKSDCLVLLQQGQVDAISTDDTILAGFAAQDPRTEVRGPVVGDGEPYGIGVAPGDTDLVRAVNGVLDRMRSDGTWARIYAGTPSLGGGGTPPAPPAPRYRG